MSRCSPNVRAASRMFIPSTITARRTRGYTATLYIHRTTHKLDFKPMNGGRRSGLQPPNVSDLPTRTVHFSMVRKAVIRHKIKSPRRVGEGFCGTLSAIGLAGLSSHGRFHCRTGRGLITLRE